MLVHTIPAHESASEAASQRADDGAPSLEIVANLIHFKESIIPARSSAAPRGTTGILNKVVRRMQAGKFTVTLLIGAPGAGKGTQAQYMRESLGIPHVSTGDLLRDHRRRGTDLGKMAAAYMDHGDLVPDEVVVNMVLERLEEPDADHGVVLDGFPRTLHQADTLDAELEARGGGVLVALYLDVPPSVLVGRLSGRRICEGCAGTFHIEMHKLPADGSCPNCGKMLVQRRDDEREAVARRIDVFMNQTQPVLEHYRALRLVHLVHADQPVEQIKDEVLSVLQEVQPSLCAS